MNVGIGDIGAGNVQGGTHRRPAHRTAISATMPATHKQPNVRVNIVPPGANWHNRSGAVGPTTRHGGDARVTFDDELAGGDNVEGAASDEATNVFDNLGAWDDVVDGDEEREADEFATFCPEGRDAATSIRPRGMDCFGSATRLAAVAVSASAESNTPEGAIEEEAVGRDDEVAESDAPVNLDNKQVAALDNGADGDKARGYDLYLRRVLVELKEIGRSFEEHFSLTSSLGLVEPDGTFKLDYTLEILNGIIARGEALEVDLYLRDVLVTLKEKSISFEEYISSRTSSPEFAASPEGRDAATSTLPTGTTRLAGAEASAFAESNAPAHKGANEAASLESEAAVENRPPQPTSGRKRARRSSNNATEPSTSSPRRGTGVHETR
jgi:hypothetical protein